MGREDGMRPAAKMEPEDAQKMVRNRSAANAETKKERTRHPQQFQVEDLRGSRLI